MLSDCSVMFNFWDVGWLSDLIDGEKGIEGSSLRLAYLFFFFGGEAIDDDVYCCT